MDLWILEHIAPIFYTLLELSLAAVCIGLGVLLLRKLLDKKIPPIWKNALWLLMLVALVMPFRPTSSTAVIPTTEVDFRQQGIQLVVEVAEASTESGTSGRVPAETVAQVETYETMSLIFEVMVPVLWLLGMGVMLLILLFSRIRFSGFLMACKGDSFELDSLLEECKGQLGVTQRVALYQQSYLKSPALYGLFRPTILLPDYVEELSEDSLRYILLHELSHLKHHDLWKNALLLALQIVYWFNPLVWVLFRFIRQDMELLNDERVLKTLQKSEETPYAMSLIEVLGHANKLPLAPQMLCMVDNKNNIKRRIQMIQLGEVFKKHKLIIAVGCLAVIGVLSALFLTSQASPLHWAHTLDKDDIEKVELYWMEQGQEDLTFLLDENQRATLWIMLNNCNGEETDDTDPGTGVQVQYSVYLTDGTVQTISFHPAEADTYFFRMGKTAFWGDSYQMNDWMGLVENVTTQSAVAQPETPPTSNEPQPLLDLANDPTVTIVDYVPMDDMAYGQVGIVCYIEGEGDTVWISYLTQEYEAKAGIGSDGSASPLPNSKLTYLGNAVCEIDLFSHTTGEEVTFTMEYWPNDGEVPGTNFKVTASDYVPPQPLTADQLSYFNETYFNGATGQNLNLANQFLHSPFSSPADIDLSMLFYLGAGADYAMSEDGEYDAVAQAYGFDSWADIPTDVTAIPAQSMDDMLEQYTGIDLFATNKIGLDHFKYLEQYDCYYNLHGDTNYYGDVDFVSGTQTGDQIVLSYYNSWQQADYILTLVDYGGGDYKIYSNLPAIIAE